MSKKMKGVALESSNHGSFEARFKHQSLIQDYQEIKKETEVAINKLEVMKQRKLTLLAEVRFLRQRRKHLLEMKETNPQQGQKSFHHPILQTRHRSVTKENNGGKKEKKLQSQAPTLDLKTKKISSKLRESAYINQKEKNNPGVDLTQKERKNSSKEATFKHPSEVLHWNKKESFSLGMELNSQKKDLGFDLNLMEKSYAVKKEPVQNHRALAFDLNLELAEEDLQENNESSRSEEHENFSSVGNEEQPNDLKLSICRNVENVPNHSGKRKISWQDPMALKV